MTGMAALALLLTAAPARAAFEAGVYSPRAAAMGAAMTAVADDPVSQLYNPATLGPIDDTTVGLNYLRQFHTPAGEVNQDLMDIVAAIPVRQEIVNGTFGVGTVYNRQNGVGVERTVFGGFSSRALWQRDLRRLDVGGTFKILKKSVDDGGSGAARMALDTGLLYRWAERYALGFSLLNWNGPSIQSGGYRDRAPAEMRLGVSESARGFTYSLDLAKREPSGRHAGTAELAAGFERWWATPRNGSYAARTGLSLGDREKTWSWGLGWRVFGAQFDYAMTVPISGATRFGHAVAIVFRFGQSNPEAEYERVLATEIRYRKDLVEALEAGEVKQWKLAEELSRMRDEMDALRQKLATKAVTESDTRKRMRDLEERHQRAMETFERIKSEARKVKDKTKQQLFEEDWGAYQRLKLSAAPDTVLLDHLKRLLSQYKDTGVDLSPASQELVRLLRTR
jgi:hypothetical protein